MPNQLSGLTPTGAPLFRRTNSSTATITLANSEIAVIAAPASDARIVLLSLSAGHIHTLNTRLSLRNGSGAADLWAESLPGGAQGGESISRLFNGIPLAAGVTLAAISQVSTDIVTLAVEYILERL